MFGDCVTLGKAWHMTRHSKTRTHSLIMWQNLSFQRSYTLASVGAAECGEVTAKLPTISWLPTVLRTTTIFEYICAITVAWLEKTWIENTNMTPKYPAFTSLSEAIEHARDIVKGDIHISDEGGESEISEVEWLLKAKPLGLQIHNLFKVSTERASKQLRS